MHRIIQTPPEKLGRRGAVLAVLGLLWILIGVGVVAVDYRPTPILLLSVFPEVRGAVWVVTGIVASIFAWKPQGRDWPGFVALYVMVAYRTLAYLIDWVSGRSTSVVGLLFWLIVAVLVYTIAGWREARHFDKEVVDE